MAISLTSQLNDALNKLAEKAEQLQQDAPYDQEQEERLMAAFERLTEIMNNLERQKKLESRLAQKLQKTVVRLDNVLNKKDRPASGELVEKIERLAGTLKVVGQVTEVVAGSMQVVTKAFREKKDAGAGAENGETKNDPVDLTGILSSLNDLIKSKVGAQSVSGEDRSVSPSGTPTNIVEAAGARAVSPPEPHTPTAEPCQVQAASSTGL